MIRPRPFVLAGLGFMQVVCGGGSTSPTTSATPPVSTSVPPLTHTVLDTRDFSLRGGAGIFYNQDKLPEGTLDVTMEWQNGDINIQVYLTEANTCVGATALITGGCQILAKAIEANEKPKRITFNVPAGKPSLAVWVYNASRQGDSGSVEVGLTSRERPETPAVGASPPPSDHRSTLPDGPVAIAFAKVRSIDVGRNRYRDPFQDRDGFWIVHDGEFVVFDLTQKNAGNQECKWVNDPTWEVEDPAFVFQIKGSSQPFLLRADVTKDDGVVEVKARIDGVESNVVKIKAKRP